MSQKVLVAGTGISGIAAAKLLLAQGGEVVLYNPWHTVLGYVQIVFALLIFLKCFYNWS